VVYFCDFAHSEIFEEKARELGVGRLQFYEGVNGLIFKVSALAKIEELFLLSFYSARVS